MSKLVLIDGNAIMHRAYHALPKTLTTKKDEPINAVYGFVSMFLRVISELKPTHIAVCFDRKEPTFRKKMYKKYQSHRPETDRELITQFAKAKDVVTSFGVPIFEKAGFEADDLIGTIAAKAERKKVDQVVIVTGDKDILQLVTDKIKVYLPARGIVNAKLHGINEVILKLGVTPEQIIDYKALVGDPSDNYPGVYGIGPKTAEDLLDKYETFENVYKHLKDLPESTAKKLKKGKKEGKISYKLAKIVKDVPIKFDLEKMKKWKIDSDETLNLFAEFGFRTLAKRIKEVGESLEKEKQGSLF